jgi:hypothetical protein
LTLSSYSTKVRERARAWAPMEAPVRLWKKKAVAISRARMPKMLPQVRPSRRCSGGWLRWCSHTEAIRPRAKATHIPRRMVSTRARPVGSR